MNGLRTQNHGDLVNLLAADEEPPDRPQHDLWMKTNINGIITNAMPEAFALRRLVWQLFATLTFRSPLPRSHRDTMLFTWLRRIARSCRIHFKYNLLWLTRYELGRRTGNGHYHICVAGLPPEFVKVEHLRAWQSLWWQHGGGFAEIESYDHARDGVGYVLKLPSSPFDSVRDSNLKDDGDDCFPTLSASLVEMMRRRPI